MATSDHIRSLRLLCDRYELEDRKRLDSYSDARLAGDVYNGAGPDSWIPLARDVLTAFMNLFEPAVLIHDLQFYESDALHETFCVTAKIWERNTRKIYDAEFPLWTWRMFSADYRRKRVYWYGVMIAANKAIAGDSAYRAWVAAHNGRIDV